jgi:hypothetical protein
MPIEKYDNQIRTSLRGREIGLDGVRRLAGVPGLRVPTEFSTAGSTLDETGGLAVLSGSTDAWTLRAPLVAGVDKLIVNASTLSTATMSIVRSTANGACAFLGSTEAGGGTAGNGRRINLIAYGAAVRLVSISSAVWAPVGNIGNVASSGITYSVSTSS